MINFSKINKGKFLKILPYMDNICTKLGKKFQFFISISLANINYNINSKNNTYCP